MWGRPGGAPYFVIERWACERPRWRWPLVMVVAVVIYAWACQADAAGVAAALTLPALAHTGSPDWAALDDLDDLATLLGDEDLAYLDLLAPWALAFFVVGIGLAAVFL